MLASRVSCRSCFSNQFQSRGMNCLLRGNNLMTTNIGQFCMNVFKFRNIIRPIWCNQTVGYRDSICYRPQRNVRLGLGLSVLYFKDLKAFHSSKPGDIVDKKLGKSESDTTKPKKPKKELKTYITLLGLDNSISVSTVEAAKKLADRRNLQLVKVVDFDPKNSRAVYKLMTDSQYLKEDWDDDSKSKKDKSNIKDEKLVSLSSNTNENDVLTRLRMMKKWLAKKFEVRVVITGDVKSGENVYKIIEKELGSDGRIVQKRAKNSTIRFQILPPKKSEEKVNKTTETE